MHLHHITITTGDNRRSWRHEIEPRALASSAMLLDAAIRDGRVALPVEPAGLDLQVTAQGRCMVATVWHDEVPLVTFGVAAHSRCGASLWRMLCSGATVTAEGRRAINPDSAPQEPWCAARLEPGIAVMMDVAPLLGDLERCIAWAWLDRLERQRGAQ
jgi:hypothetical protein